jgi:serine/threonine kinase 16
MHEHRYSHRDIKVDNVLLTATPATSGNSFRHHYHHGNSSSPSLSYTPVLMDFGSAGPLVETIKSRRDQLEALERASTHTTVSYRPPELFEGGVRVGDTLDYEKADVWSLGCTLFASSYGQGASPSECEFVRNVGSGNNFSSTGGAAGVRVVECTHLKVLAGLPQNPPPWYSSGLWSLLEDMLEQDPSRRPTLPVVMERVQHLLQQARGGDGTVSASGVLGGSENNHDRQFAIRPAADNDEGDDDVELANQFL